jgi:FkbM family methyltransferase
MLSELKKLIPRTVRRGLADMNAPRIHARVAYSQEGEDLLLGRLFEGDSAGIYVDVGAHHPFRFSNTCLLHKRGWRGINLDALPGSMRLFRRFRPDDVNLELGVSEQPGQLEFFVFAEPALNTFDAALAGSRRAEGWAFVGKTVVECLPLATIIDKHLPQLQSSKVDLLTIDAEGLDLQVLRSNDWDRYQPRVIVVEILGGDLSEMMRSDTVTFLAGVGYSPSARLYNSVVFLPRASSQT